METPNELVAVESCQRDVLLNLAQWETWSYGDTSKFFYGESFHQVLPVGFPYTILPVPDDYLSLSIKTQAIVRLALDSGADYLHIVDSDAFVLPDYLLLGDYVGRKNPHGGYAIGCFYTLSRKAMEYVAEAPITSPYEDLWVGSVMEKAGIPLTVDPNRFLLNKGGGLSGRNWHQVPKEWNAVGELTAQEMRELWKRECDPQRMPHGRKLHR